MKPKSATKPAGRKTAKPAGRKTAKPVKKKAAKRGGQRTPIELCENLTALYDRLGKLAKKAAAGKKAGEESRAAKEALVAAMGAHKRAKLADGRIIERDLQKRHWAPLPAKTVAWWRFIVVNTGEEI